MDDYDVLHLPVLSEDKLVGLIAKDDLIDATESDTHLSSEDFLQKIFVKNDEHFLTALKLISSHELSLLPVVNDQMELKEVVLAKELIKAVSLFLGIEERGAVIVLETEKRNFLLVNSAGWLKPTTFLYYPAQYLYRSGNGADLLLPLRSTRLRFRIS